MIALNLAETARRIGGREISSTGPSRKAWDRSWRLRREGCSPEADSWIHYTVSGTISIGNVQIVGGIFSQIPVPETPETQF